MTFHRPRDDFMTVIRKLGLSSGLKVCLDMGHEATSTATAKWLDISGNGYNFFKGTIGGPDGADPTVNGTQGGRSSSEYLSFDGGDFLRYDTANESWMENLHKSNAKFTVASWIYGAGATNSNNSIFGTHSDFANKIGISLKAHSGVEAISFAGSNGDGGSGMISVTSTNLVPRNTWAFVALSYDEAVPAGTFCVNGLIETFATAYSSPSASNASYTMELGAVGNAFRPLQSGSRMASIAMWEGTVLKADALQALFMATRSKFGV